MIISIRNTEDKAYILEPTPLDELMLGNRKPVVIKPGTILWLRIYADANLPLGTWRPVDHDNISVLDATTCEADQGLEPEVDPSWRLLLRVRFEALNDGPLRKLVRWGLRVADLEEDHDPSTFRTKRIPLHVMPSKGPVIAVAGSITTGVFFAALADLAISYAAGRDVGADFSAWLLAVFMTIPGVMLFGLTFFTLANTFSWFSPNR